MISRPLLEPNLSSTIMERQVRTILMVAPYAGNGATTCTLSLAQGLGEHFGESVLAIDGNLKAPRLHELFNMALTPGFRALIEGFPAADVCIHREPDLGFDVMPAGRAEASLTINELRERMRAIFGALLERYRYIVFDGMAIQTNPEALAISPVFDGVILVLESEATPWSVGATIKDKLERSGARLLGAMLNKRRLHIPAPIYNAL